MSLYALGPGYVSKAQEKALYQKAKTATRRAVYAAVNMRDKYRCRACRSHAWKQGKSDAGRKHHHHLRFLSQGGKDSAENIIIVCVQCHEFIHRHILTVIGTDANKDLTFVQDGRTWKG